MAEPPTLMIATMRADETTTSDNERGQVTASAAEVYDAFFVPALFAQWPAAVLAAADVCEGQRVLDIGCGTGVLAREAHARVGPGGRVTAVDPNDGMLAVARRAEPAIDWRNGVAEELPFPDESFDRAVSQFAAMFFTDPAAACSEIGRVTRRDGRIALAVWDRLEHNVGYARLAALLEELFGADAADAIRFPFSLGDEATLTALAAHGIDNPSVTRRDGIARFDSLAAWLHTEIKGWTLADVIDDDDFARLLTAASERLADLVGDDGVAFETSALIVSGRPSPRSR